MKKVVKIILPILLSLTILLSIGWYLFIYDTEFTRDVLLSSARYFESEGNHSLAAWFYDMAYDQADDNDAVAIELALQHKAAGNYTQAEITLSNAIADGGTANLYIALSNLYLEQDKILDAVKLLDAVCSENSTVNQAVRQELIAMRPAAPTVSPDPGFYSQYINVTVTGQGGTLYVSNQYPSVKDATYTKLVEGAAYVAVNGSVPGVDNTVTETINLVEGENAIYALTISDQGLVSPVSIFGYTVGGVIVQVEFADDAIEAQVRKMLNVSENTVLHSNDLWKITEFTIPEGTKKLDDLKHMIRLETLTIENCPSNSLSFLSSLSDLTKLTIRNMPVKSEDLAQIGRMPKLTELTLSNCSLSTISGLENATKLTSLDLSGNTVRNLSPIASMPQMVHLDLKSNAVEDLSSLSGLTHLQTLDISHNTLRSIAPLSGISSLKWLDLSYNTVSDITDAGKLTGLQHLDVSYNGVTDVSPLAACTSLNDLNISNNSIEDISALSVLNGLNHFDFNHNQVKELPAWDTKSCQLITIDGSHNQIKSVEVLAGMSRLNKVFMDYNPELKDIICLQKCTLLIQVNAYGTKVEDIKALADMSVIVNYDPTK